MSRLKTYIYCALPENDQTGEKVIFNKGQVILLDRVKLSRIGPLQDPVTWYGINYAGTQLPKQRKVGLDWYEFLCFGSPTASFASQRNVFRTM